MKYGLIGEHLSHSFSKEIHQLLGNSEYEIHEIAKDELDSFLKQKDFLGINVTIPYKQAVIDYLDVIDDAALKIGAVNTIVNKDGKLYGYNTDFYGLKNLIELNDIQIENKNVYILGTGGTSKTAHAVCEALKAKKIVHVSSKLNSQYISYDELYRQNDVDIIINTTFIGMYPNNDDQIIDLDKFDHIQGVVDVIYNPIQTSLIQQAKSKNIKSSGGLLMLVSQAIVAHEYFFDTKVNQDLLQKIFNTILKSKQNIVLIGMPASGKTTIANYLKEKLNRDVIDADEYLVKKYNKEITDIFKEDGEKAFREYETEVINELSKKNNIIISTGGGCILNPLNIKRLKQNGILYFIDRNLDLLIPSDDRPTANSKDAIIKRYNERIDLYRQYCDIRINNSSTIEDSIKQIMETLE